MKILFQTAVMIAFFAAGAPARGDGSALATAQQHFNAANAALNKAYQSSTDELGNAERVALRSEQRDWLRYRDATADARSSGGGEEVPAKLRPDYWETLAGLTEERTKYLAAYSGKNVPAGVSGEYHDSYGGTLLLEERADGFAFSIEVVRGPAMNEGSLDGRAIRKGAQAVFKDKADPDDPGEPCEIIFTFIGGHIVQLEEKNAGKYQGHNAHFDGRYFKTGKLGEPLK